MMSKGFLFPETIGDERLIKIIQRFIDQNHMLPNQSSFVVKLVKFCMVSAQKMPFPPQK